MKSPSMDAIDRRRFLKSTAALAALTALRPRLSSAAGASRKAIQLALLPDGSPGLERFGMAADAGFTGIEMGTVDDPGHAEQVRLAAGRAGLRIHSVRNTALRRCPITSADPAVVRQGLVSIETSLRNAGLWGADAVLLTPAAADAGTPYRDAWSRSQQVLRERVLPLARELRVVVAIDGVWDGFLLGPAEFTRYVDAFDSRWVKAGFDMGHIVFYTYPQDWIRTLGSRIVKVRLRDFRVESANGGSGPRSIGAGDADWPGVRGALADIGYDGWLTTAAGDAASFRDAAARLDLFLDA